MEYDSSSAPTLRDLFRRVFRRRTLLLVIGLGVLAIVTAWTFLATPRYRSAALLRIDSKNSSPSIPDALKDIAGAAGGLALGKDELDTDIGVLRSARMLDATIDALALTVLVTKPADDRTRVLRARILDSLDVSGKLVFTRRADGRYDLSVDDLKGAGQVPAILSAGDSIRIGSVMLALPESLRAAGPPTIKVRLRPRYLTHERLEKRLTIRKQEGGSRLVEVAFEDPDRQLAASFIARLVREYVTYANAVDRTESGSRLDSLRSALASTRVQLTTAEEQLRVFQSRSRMIVPEAQAEQQVKRIAAIDARNDAVRIERNALERLMALIRERSRGGTDPTAFRQLATFPSLISNRAIQDLLQSLIELETKRSALTVTRTSENAEVQQFSSRIAELESQLYRLGNQYLESLDQQMSSTDRAVSTLNDTLSQLPANSLQYLRLLRERTILNETYLQLIKQLKLYEIQDLIRNEKVRVIDVPHVANADDPVFPRKAVQLVLGALLAITLSLAIGIGVELWSETAP
jgi:uncharacterized protein involved in exopolysaccharide biosynthesis